MATLDMSGPYSLTESGVKNALLANRIGNYALGSLDSKGTFLVNYVGRSDVCVQGRLLQHVGKIAANTHFKASYALTVKEAFEKECKNYHEFDPAQNSVHPARPADKDWKCPYCRILD